MYDDDDINMMVRFIAQNRFPIVEVYVENKDVGQYGGGVISNQVKDRWSFRFWIFWRYNGCTTSSRTCTGNLTGSYQRLLLLGGDGGRDSTSRAWEE
ncbi:unnamed protein product [Linum trigynum]|uniref:Uncharacterized protein n=1 Tax=Linum trigynum TaxID=586398 RepID=A0AAV2D7R4_9ROSI